MGNLKSNRFKSDIISASEVGQFYFCSMAWYLKKCGYEPQSPYLDSGTKKHIEHGKIIDYSNSYLKKSRIYILAGIIFLIIAFFIFLFEVMI